MPPKKIINIKNPYNPMHNLYKKLTRLWAGPLVTAVTPKTFELSKKNLDKYQNHFKTASDQPFERQDVKHPSYYLYTDTFINAMRAERYFEFDQMEMHPDCAAILETYADELCSHTDLNPPIKIISNNLDIKECLNTFFYKTLKMKQNLHPLAFNVCKYGDLFAYLDVDEKLGVTNIIQLPPGEVERLEGQDPTNPNYVQFQWNRAGQTYEYGWNVVHFRNLMSDKYAPYGQSIHDSARRAYHQLNLLENAVIGYRIVRAPERKVYYVDIGGINDEDVVPYINEIKKNLKESVLTDGDSGRAERRYNAMSIENDIIIPVRGQNSGTKVESLPGGQWQGSIDDLKHARDKLFSAYGVPASYFSQDSQEGDRQSLAQKDIKFGKRILRIQNSIVAGLTEIAMTHLAILGFDEQDLDNFEIKLHNPSRIAEMQELEQMRTRLDLANSSGDYFSKETQYKKFLGMSDEEIQKERILKFADAKYDLAIQQFEDTGEGGGGLGGGMPSGGGGDSPFGGMSDAGNEDNPFNQMPEDDGSGGSDSPLIEEPSDSDIDSLSQKKLKDDEYLTPGAKGKAYSREKVDKRFAGARMRHNKAVSPMGQSKANRQNIFGSGFQSLRSLSKGIMSENNEPEDFEDDEYVEMTSEELLSLNESLINEINKESK